METIEHDLLSLIQQGESLTLEFKSDLKCLADRELLAAVVSLANIEGGDLLLGIEDDGEITGLHANHVNVSGIPSLIANKTHPAMSVRVERYELRGKSIARITVPRSRKPEKKNMHPIHDKLSSYTPLIAVMHACITACMEYAAFSVSACFVVENESCGFVSSRGSKDS